MEQAQANASTVMARLEQRYPETNEERGAVVLPASSVRVFPMIDDILVPVAGLLQAVVALVLLLACGGIYGSMLYSVSQRQREMGIRLALGAAGGNVMRLILGHGAVLTVIGLGIGVAGALGLSRFMDNLVWGIQPTDPLTFVGVTLVLAAAALAACFFPAYKASRADPLQTLRAE